MADTAFDLLDHVDLFLSFEARFSPSLSLFFFLPPFFCILLSLLRFPFSFLLLSFLCFPFFSFSPLSCLFSPILFLSLFLYYIFYTTYFVLFVFSFAPVKSRSLKSYKRFFFFFLILFSLCFIVKQVLLYISTHQGAQFRPRQRTTKPHVRRPNRRRSIIFPTKRFGTSLFFFFFFFFFFFLSVTLVLSLSSWDWTTDLLVRWGRSEWEEEEMKRLRVYDSSRLLPATYDIGRETRGWRIGKCLFVNRGEKVRAERQNGTKRGRQDGN